MGAGPVVKDAPPQGTGPEMPFFGPLPLGENEDQLLPQDVDNFPGRVEEWPRGGGVEVDGNWTEPVAHNGPRMGPCNVQLEAGQPREEPGETGSNKSPGQPVVADESVVGDESAALVVGPVVADPLSHGTALEMPFVGPYKNVQLGTYSEQLGTYDNTEEDGALQRAAGDRRTCPRVGPCSVQVGTGQRQGWDEPAGPDNGGAQCSVESAVGDESAGGDGSVVATSSSLPPDVLDLHADDFTPAQHLEQILLLPTTTDYHHHTTDYLLLTTGAQTPLLEQHSTSTHSMEQNTNIMQQMQHHRQQQVPPSAILPQCCAPPSHSHHLSGVAQGFQHVGIFSRGQTRKTRRDFFTSPRKSTCFFDEEDEYRICFC